MVSKLLPSGWIYLDIKTYILGSAFYKPIRGLAVGVSATGAIDAFTRGLALDLAPLRVNAVFPGLVKTEVCTLIVL